MSAPLEPVTVLTRGRPVVISAVELDAELAGDGPCRSLAHLEAVVRSNDRLRSVARLRRAVASGDVGVQTMQAVFGLVRLEAAESAGELRALADRLGGSPGAIARAAAFLVEGRAAELAHAATADALLARHSPQPYLHLQRVPDGAPLLFATWLAELERSATALGVTAFRAFVGDVAEAAFRSLQHGADAVALLGERGASFLVDIVCAELGGTTDFVAARGMAWLAGALAAGDDTARSAIERARDRFRDPEFQHDCEAMLGGEPWPPRR
ncbi:MAG TPA: hypothetical protein VFF06_05285 [Polyangia bacterium]|nr:hypothetical protein [Polyangia bacterium]